MLLLNDIEKRFWQILDQPDIRPELVIKKFIQLSQLVGISCDSEEVLKELKVLSYDAEKNHIIANEENVLNISRFLFEQKGFKLDTSENIRGLFIEKTLKEKQGHPICIALIFQLLCHWHRSPVNIVQIDSKLLIRTTHSISGKNLYLDLSDPYHYLNDKDFLSLLSHLQREGEQIENLDFSKLFTLSLDIFERHFENKKLFKLLLLTLEIKTQIKPSDITSLKKKIRLNLSFSRTTEVQKDLKKLSFISDFKQWPLDLQKIYLKLDHSTATDLSHQ